MPPKYCDMHGAIHQSFTRSTHASQHACFTRSTHVNSMLSGHAKVSAPSPEHVRFADYKESHYVGDSTLTPAEVKRWMALLSTPRYFL
jgi:hypothetical protein